MIPRRLAHKTSALMEASATILEEMQPVTAAEYAA